LILTSNIEMCEDGFSAQTLGVGSETGEIARQHAK
jgi:hypothetical protein